MRRILRLLVVAIVWQWPGSAVCVSTADELLRIAQSPDVHGHIEIEPANIGMDAPEWPIYTFLLGEAYLAVGQVTKATESYRSLLSRSVGRDTVGRDGGGVLAVALWRLLQHYSAGAASWSDEPIYLLGAADRLLQRRDVRRFFSPPGPRVHIGLEKFREDILRRATAVAYQIGDMRHTRKFFRESLAIRTSAEFSAIETDILDRLVEDGTVGRELVALQLGKHLKEIGEHFDAIGPLELAFLTGETAEVRAEAGLHLSQLWRFEGRPREEIIELLDSVVEDAEAAGDVPSDLVQDVLFERAVRQNREGSGRNVESAIRDFSEIVETFGAGDRVDDAIYQLAQLYQREGNEAKASEYYTKLRQYGSAEYANDWSDSAYFRPALAKFGVGTREGYDQAKSLLERLIDRYGESGALYVHAKFWKARILEELGETESSRKLFRKIISNNRRYPGVYYAIRSQMHIDHGRSAAEMVLPSAQTLDRLGIDRLEPDTGSERAAERCGNSRRYRRVAWALDAGVYARARNGGLGRILERGVTITQRSNPHFLDRSRTLASVVVQHALIQEARMLSAAERLCIARRMSEVGDWPSTIAIVPNFGEIRDVSGWIGVAYPAAYAKLIAEQSDRYGVPGELLYAVARKESWFSRAAVSSAGALGLFQFLPRTFEELNERWQLLDGRSGATATTEGYLTDVLLSIDLGARWFRHLIQAQSGSVVRAIMEHNAGGTAVSKWTNEWELAKRGDDVEYMVETARYGQTRIFTRRVLELMAVVHGTGLLDQ